jgi:hypothetical protein
MRTTHGGGWEGENLAVKNGQKSDPPIVEEGYHVYMMAHIIPR